MSTYRRQPHQLPPGRHGLGREYVTQNQRSRILRAVADVVSVAGYADTSVEDIIVTAGVSRRTFYDHYASKDDAFLAEYDLISAALIDCIQAVYDPALPLPERGDRCLQAVMEFFCREPAYADVCVIESLAAGTAAIARRDQAIRGLAALIDEAAGDLPASTLPPQITAQAIVGGIYEVMHSRIRIGELDELPELVPDMLYAMLLPYVGREEAAKGMKAARRRRARARLADDAASP